MIEQKVEQKVDTDVVDDTDYHVCKRQKNQIGNWPLDAMLECILVASAKSASLYLFVFFYRFALVE